MKLASSLSYRVATRRVAFVREVGKPNVKVMLDTFHMNIEEDSFGNAIRTAGLVLGHFHTGENNRRVPGKGRLPWHEIGTALREIGYGGAVVMEPFVKMGGGVGSDVKVWRDLSDNADEAQMDEAARQALAFSRYVLG
jgi:D-psicose/D-tagatose/L-ribulose 3-epimerase